MKFSDLSKLESRKAKSARHALSLRPPPTTTHYRHPTFTTTFIAHACFWGLLFCALVFVAVCASVCVCVLAGKCICVSVCVLPRTAVYPDSMQK